VILRGTVGSFGQRRAAVSDARKIAGVYDVYDELNVRLLNDSRRDDAEIRGVALQMLMWDAEIPSDLLDVHVEDGWVTLKGDVYLQYQSDAAFDDVASLFASSASPTRSGSRRSDQAAGRLRPPRCDAVLSRRWRGSH